MPKHPESHEANFPASQMLDSVLREWIRLANLSKLVIFLTENGFIIDSATLDELRNAVDHPLFAEKDRGRITRRG